MTPFNLYRGRPNWTTYITYYDGYREAFLHCGRCLSVIPTGHVKCEHCTEQREKQKERFEAFINTKKEEESLL